MSAPRPLSEAISAEILHAITGHLDSLSFWQEVCDRAAVVLVGSCAAGLVDQSSDVDVDLLVDADDFDRLYHLFKLLWERASPFAASVSLRTSSRRTRPHRSIEQCVLCQSEQ